MKAARLEIGGMSCGHCVQSVEKALRAVPGVEVRRVAVGSAEVQFDPATTTAQAAAAAVEQAGYEAREVAASDCSTADGSCCRR